MPKIFWNMYFRVELLVYMTYMSSNILDNAERSKGFVPIDTPLEPMSKSSHCFTSSGHLYTQDFIIFANLRGVK